MKIEISGTSSEALLKHVRERLTAALNQYRWRVASVDVRLDDVNGPRGGVDQRCQVQVRLRPKGNVLVTELSDDLYLAVSHAADRVRNTVGRSLERRKHRLTPRGWFGSRVAMG
jgi:putative sigma-54 modulation protein